MENTDKILHNNIKFSMKKIKPKYPNCKGINTSLLTPAYKTISVSVKLAILKREIQMAAI